MRNLLIILFIPFLLGCTHDDLTNPVLRLKDGSYEGSFIYDTLQLWESFGIKKDSFEEYASGGMRYQKYPVYALTKGTYEIIGDIIYFNKIKIAQPPGGNIDNYEKEFLLMGNYVVENQTDSTIIFWRTSRKGRQEYSLKLFFISR
jgi:hypothetical protein